MRRHVQADAYFLSIVRIEPPAGLITTRAFQFGTAPVTTRALFEDNPLVQQLNVRPSEFEQHQFTTRLDGRLTKNNTLTGTFFFSNFPALDSFPDPSSLISPFVLRRADRNRTLAISDQHVFGPTLINEVRLRLLLFEQHALA